MEQSNKSIKLAMVIVITLVIIGTVGIYLFNKYGSKHDSKPLPKPVVIDTNHQPTLGSATAKVHIVAFEDLKCSNCARFNNTLYPKIKKKYIDTGLAKYTMINLAFIPGSLPAANAARCVYMQNNQLFFPYVEYIYHHQPPENQNWATIPTLLDIANRIKGINVDKLGECLVASPYDDLISNNLKQASKLMNGEVATPTVYINGILVSPLTMTQFKHVFDAAQ